MKFINEAVSVEARNKVPCRIQWENRIYRTRKLIDYWILQTRWWGREEKRIYFRLETDRGILEVYRSTESSIPGVREGEVFGKGGGFGEGDRIGKGGGFRDGHGFGGSDGFRDGDGAGVGAAPRPPLPVEGDTHTRERRRTDAVYRPDVRMAGTARRTASRAVPASSPPRTRWMLSKILD